METDTNGTGYTTRWPLLVLLLLAFAVQGLRLDYMVDDAFISFRYADNLVHGHGLTYNPGGPRVEGYTNFAWTLIMAGAIRMGLNPQPIALLIGLASGLAVLLLAERLARRMDLGRWSLLVVALLAANPALVTWSIAGLETSFFTALVLTGVLVLLAPGAPVWAAGIPLALACLTRPEGIFVVGLLALGLLWARGPRELFRFAPVGAIVAITVGAHTIWRYAYYGAWLPNTFYAKTGDLVVQLSTGWVYVYGVLSAFAGGLLFVLVLVLAWRRRDPAVVVSSVFVVGWLGYVLVIGGDGLPMFRFAVPALPFLAALVATAIVRSLANRPLAAGAVAAVAVLLTLAPGVYGPAFEYRELDRKYFVPKVVAVGRSLRDLVGVDASIALLPAGAIPYFSRLETVDMLALNDPVVARKELRLTGRLPGHWKHDAGEVLRQQPDYVLLGNVDVTSEPREDFIPPLFPVEHDLLQIESFRSDYELVSLPLPGGGWLNCYRRRGLG